MPPRMVINITRKRSREFHFDLARFFRTALAPSLPRAVRVFFDKCAIVLFRRAALVAFLMFRFAAARCVLAVTISRNRICPVGSSVRREPRCTQRRRFRVRAAFFAAAERDCGERCRATRFACLDNACFDADRRLSRLSARFAARERFREGFPRDPERPFARSRFAWRFVRCGPRFGGGNFTPARRAFERPMAIACSGERAPCLPSRMCSVSSRTNSPAWVEGDLPSRSSSRARSIGSCSGITK